VKSQELLALMHVKLRSDKTWAPWSGLLRRVQELLEVELVNELLMGSVGWLGGGVGSSLGGEWASLLLASSLIDGINRDLPVFSSPFRSPG